MLFSNNDSEKGSPHGSEGLSPGKKAWHDLTAQQLVRYEALFKLLEDMLGADDIYEIAQQVAKQWKYFANVASWRLMISENDEFVMVDGFRGQATVNRIGENSLSSWERYHWEKHCPSIIPVSAIDPNLVPPDHLVGSIIHEIQILPIFRNEKCVAILYAGSRREPFNDLDIKYIRLLGNYLIDRITSLLLQKAIKDIMNNIGTAIFTINSDMTVNTEHSKIAELYFSLTDFSQANVKQLLHLSDESERKFSMWLETVFSSQMVHRSWKKLEKICPVKEIEKENKNELLYLRIGYQPIFDQNKLIRIMVLATDITRQKNAEFFFQQSKNEKETQMERVQMLLENRPEVIDGFLDDARSILTILDEKEASQLFSESDTFKAFCRNVHTVKGLSGSISLTKFPRVLNSIEDLTERLITGKKPDIQFLNNWKELHREYRNELSAITDMRKKLFSGNENRLSIDKKDCVVFVDKIIRNEFKSNEFIVDGLIELSSVPLYQFFRRHNKVIEFYCVKNEKKVNPLRILNPLQKIPRSLARQLDGPITHIIRNCLDHGIESPRKRSEDGKPEAGTITIESSHTNNSITLTIIDDGKGLDDEMIAQSALKKGFVTRDQIAAMSTQQKQELIMFHGFSTKENATEISGRGVGMAAVKEGLTSLKGDIRILSRKGKGTTFILTIPVDLKNELDVLRQEISILDK